MRTRSRFSGHGWKHLASGVCLANIVHHLCDAVILQAVENDHENCVALLVDEKADLVSADMDGNTCLHLASGVGLANIVQILCDAKASLMVKNKVRSVCPDLGSIPYNIFGIYCNRSRDNSGDYDDDDQNEDISIFFCRH